MVLASTRQREQLAQHHTWGEVGISVLGVPKLPCTSTAEHCQMERGRRGKSPPASCCSQPQTLFWASV